MPNDSSVYQHLCDRLGVDKKHRAQLFWASIVGIPVVWWALGTRSRAKQKPHTSIEAFFKDKSVKPAAAAQATRRKQATSFDSFLKEPPPAQRKATDFSSFLKAPETAEASGSSCVPPVADVSGPEADDIVITVLFGTEYGFSKEVAERIATSLTASGSYWVNLLDMADHGEGLDLSRHHAVIIACSTQGDGVPPTEARDFCDWLASPAAPRLPDTHFAVCALGDRSYEHFCACGKQLDRSFESLGAKRFADRVDVNKEDLPAIDSWLSGLTNTLQGIQLPTFGQTGGVVGKSEQTAAKPRKWGKSRPYHGRVVAVQGLCNLTSHNNKDTIRVEIDLGESSLQYTPGDALGVYPLNCHQAVQEVLRTLGQDAHQQVPCPSWHYQGRSDQEQPSESAPNRQISLQEALVRCYDLRSPKPELLQLLFDHMPPGALAKAQSGTNGKALHHIPSSKPAISNGNSRSKKQSGTKISSPQANGHAHTANGNSYTANGNSYTANGKTHLVNGAASKANELGPTSSEGSLSADDRTQPMTQEQDSTVVQVDGLGNGVSSRTAHQQARHLQDILQDEVEAYLDKRHIIDILHDFSGCGPPLTSLLACLRPLQPRLYSISSSQLEHATRVQITVAVVRYMALGRERIGVTSTFLKERMQDLNMRDTQGLT